MRHNPLDQVFGGAVMHNARLTSQSREGLAQALRAYHNYRGSPRLRNRLLMFVDFSQPNTARRGRLLDVDRQRDVIEPFLVAHGARIPAGASEEERRRLAYGLVGNRVNPVTPTEFSNVPGSNLSSLGFAVTGNIDPSPNWRWRIWLDGKSGSAFNSNLRRRLAYIHPYPGVLRDSRGRAVAIATSEGCPAVEDAVFEQLRRHIPNGTAVYIWAPTSIMAQEPIAAGRSA
ncbi:MAG: murein L,D-transpeptidase catalytic domain-containing protein [Nannocystaceae bacterium]|nr:murein L,D-transpeptidase catalytic domain family protein [bacterium]